MMTSGILSDGLFECRHIDMGKSDYHDISMFTARHHEGGNLIDYIRRHAYRDEQDHEMRTYLVRDSETAELAGYFSLKAGMISINEKVKDGNTLFDTAPGVELANFAVNNEFITKHPNYKGLGYLIFNDFIFPIIESVSGLIGVKLIYLFAVNDAVVDIYTRYGFSRLAPADEAMLNHRIKPAYDNGCIFMYQNL